MKKVSCTLIVITWAIGIFSLVGCNSEHLPDDRTFTDGLWLKMGDNSIVSTTDIDFYDVSTHIIYLKKKLPYLEDIGFDSGAMTVNVGEEEIYKCPFHPMYLSYLPTGPYLSTPFFYPKDIIRIEFMQILNVNYEVTVPDPRSDERIINALKAYGQYHEGLHFEIQSCNFSAGKLVLTIVLSNSDTFDYYYLDPDKMGIGLFHYFSNGPTFWDLNYSQSYTHKETVISPEPWDSWKIEWLTRIKAGESKTISITYNHFDKMPAGKYWMNFTFPGLEFGISQKDLILSDGRIWMGSICTENLINI